jgi:hypothetical protein
VLDRSRHEGVRIQDAVDLGAFDECVQFRVFEQSVDFRSFLLKTASRTFEQHKTRSTRVTY